MTPPRPVEPFDFDQSVLHDNPAGSGRSAFGVRFFQSVVPIVRASTETRQYEERPYLWAVPSGIVVPVHAGQNAQCTYAVGLLCHPAFAPFGS